MSISSQYPHSPGATLIPDDLLWLIELLLGRVNGITPLVFPPKPFIITGPAVVTLTADQRWALVDSTLGPVSITFPTPTVPSLWIVDDWKGTSAAEPITLHAPPGWTISNPSNPGAAVTTALISNQGATVQFIAALTSTTGVAINQFIETV